MLIDVLVVMCRMPSSRRRTAGLAARIPMVASRFRWLTHVLIQVRTGATRMRVASAGAARTPAARTGDG